MNSILFFVILFATLSYAQEIIKYNLSKTDIESVTYLFAPDSTYSISIKLNTEATQKFGELTENNIGNLLQICKENRTLVEAFIKATITNGRILIGNLKNSNEVLKHIKILLE